MKTQTRRNFIRNASGLLIAAPMVCRAESLMPIFVSNRSKHLQFMKHQIQNYLNSLKGMHALPVDSFQIVVLEPRLLKVTWRLPPLILPPK